MTVVAGSALQLDNFEMCSVVAALTFGPETTPSKGNTSAEGTTVH